MQYVLSLVVGILLASAQAMWRVVAQREGITLSNIFKVILTPQFIAGALLYVAATFIYLYLQSKYLFSTIQATLIVTSLFVSLIFAWVAFSEKISPLNLVGFVFLTIGILMVTQK
jgi:drug/metabolite transporter (DMT)-like permease